MNDNKGRKWLRRLLLLFFCRSRRRLNLFLCLTSMTPIMSSQINQQKTFYLTQKNESNENLFQYVLLLFLGYSYFFRLLKLILILLCSTFLFHFLSFRLSEVPHTRANYDSWLDLLKWVEFMENIFVDAYPTHRRWIFLSFSDCTNTKFLNSRNGERKN